MRHEFTDDELKAAHKIAAKQIRIEAMHTTKYLSAFLDALPESQPPGDWVPTPFYDISLNDKAVRAIYPDGAGVQGPPIGISDDFVCINVNGRNVCVARGDVVAGRVWLYRIPAPIAHPDPEEHHLIGSVEYYDADDPDYAELGHANGNDYMLFNNGVFEATVSPEEILNWVPVRVIADE